MWVLSEIKNVRQIPGDPPRRWFADEYFDLIVWFDADGSIWGFQLCYDRESRPRALTWSKSEGCVHSGIDDGDCSNGTHKSAPILVRDGMFDNKAVGEKLAAASGDLPPDILLLLTEKINTFICQKK